MRFTPARKLGFGLVGILLFAFLSSGAAYLSASRSAEVLEDLIAENLEQSRTISELEIALLKQGGFTALYLMDGSNQWLDELSQRESYFENWLERVGQVDLEPGQREYIGRIKAAFRAYDRARNRAVQTYNEGRVQEARRILLEEVSREYNRVYELCEELSAANNKDIESAVLARKMQVKQVGIWVSVCLALLVVLVASLSWMMVTGVFGPLRRMAQSVEEYSPEGGGNRSVDEVQVVRSCLEALRATVDNVHFQLAHSNRHLLDAEQMASIGRIAAGVAHEIRSPLTSLRLRLFSMQRALSERYKADLEVITEELARLDNIINNFLEFSQPPELRLQRCNVSLVLDKTFELLRFRLDLLGIQIERWDNPDLPAVWADSQQLRQIFLNLVNNALDVMPQGGRIVVSATVKHMTDRRFVVVFVADTGPGIPEHLKESIFDPFFSTKEDGAGLGLWIAQRIATQHGGALDLVSPNTQGATFALSIPVAGEETNGFDSDRGR